MLTVLDWLRAHATPFEFVALAAETGRMADALRSRQIPIVNWSVVDETGRRLPPAQIEESLLDAIREIQPQLLHANSLAMGRITGRMSDRLALPTTAHLRDIIKLSAAAVEDLNRNQGLVAVSKATRDFHVAQGLDPRRVSVVYNGIDLETFQPRPKSGSLHRELGLQFSTASQGDDCLARIVLSIGQIGLRKGQDVLVAAAPEIVRQIPDAHFVIVGERNSQKAESVEFEKAIQQGFEASGLLDRLHLLGYRDDVASLMNEADLLVHSAHQEPLGRVLLEGMASGISIVATDVGGTPEIIEDQVTGFLIAPKEPAALAAAVVRALKDPSQRFEMQNAQRARAEAIFSHQAAAAGLLAFWHEILNVAGGS